MRRSTLLAGVLGVVAAAATTLGTAGLAGASGFPHAPSTNYVALGDSYSSGVGAGTYDLDATCERGSAAYPALYAAATAPRSFSFVACSGATATDIESGQLSALSKSTSLVSLTDGGNEAGFTTVLTACVLSDDTGCQSAVDTAENYVASTLPGVLHTLYTDIRADAPRAQVVVLGYPEFYDLRQTSCTDILDASKQAMLDAAADKLDAAIARATHTVRGFDYRDVRAEFRGHQLCDADPWLHGLDVTDLDSSYHPTAEGQQAYLAAFAGVPCVRR